MKNKKALLLAALMVCSIAASSCGKKADNSKTTTTAGSKAETTTAAENKGSEKETTEDVKKLTFDFGLDAEGKLKDVRALDYVTPYDITKVHFKESQVAPSKEELNGDVERFLNANVIRKEVKEGTIKDKDTVNIDYVGYVDGKPFANGSTNGKGTDVTIGVTQYIDNFLQQLIGHKVGDKFDVNVTFPARYPSAPDLQNKKAVFKTTINYIVKQEKPILNDKLVEEKAGIPGVKTVTEYYDFLKKQIRKKNVTNLVWKTMQEKSEFKPIPDSLVNRIVDLMLLEYKKNFALRGGTLDTALLSAGKTLEQFKQDLHKQAETSVKMILLSQAIFEKYKLTIGEKDIDELFGTVRKQVEENYGISYMKHNVLLRKGVEYISSLAKFDKDQKEAETTTGAAETTAPETTKAQ